MKIENSDVFDIEVELFLEGILKRYGYDFKDYSRAHIKRRIINRLGKENDIKTVLDFTHKVINDEEYFQKILPDFSINVTEMFRDPIFYKKLREEVIPVLWTYPFIKIWHAGCSTGEEVYSMAILLKEEGLYDKCQIYATDFNDIVLEKAKEGIYSIENIKEFTSNYIKSGGKEDFSDYYTAKFDFVKMDEELKKKIVFSNHNLVNDSVFGEMNLIICRNVLIYFTRKLQDRVFKLFYESLTNGGFLGLGSKESISFSSYKDKFGDVSEKYKIFKKLYVLD